MVCKAALGYYYRYQKGRACGAFFEDAAVDADAAADGRLPVTP